VWSDVRLAPGTVGELDEPTTNDLPLAQLGGVLHVRFPGEAPRVVVLAIHTRHLAVLEET
jgi:hypothetical protein